jgi:hypothetical protein
MSLIDRETASPPDIKPTTHLLAVCGTTEELADPTEDGWFLSDFYLFNHLFKGLGKSQQWLTSVDPDKLVQQYGEYVHGNPYHTRRVVLDSNQLPHDVRVVPEARLKSSFLSSLQDIRAKVKAKEHVLIMCFAHGDSVNYGVSLGSEHNPDCLVEPKDMRTALGQVLPDVEVTVFLTSCYSGGWVVSDALMGDGAMPEASIMAATNPVNVSESWTASVSKRLGGSMFTSAVIREMFQEEKLTSAPHPSPRAYREFVASIKHTLFNEIDVRFPVTPTFAAQGGRWEDSVADRTGIRPNCFQARYHALRAVPPADLNPILNRGRRLSDINDREIKAWEEAHDSAGEASEAFAVAARSRFGGRPHSLRSQAKFLARDYMASKPGADTLAQNTAPHRLIKQLIADELPHDRFERTLEIVLYRLQVMAVVEMYVRVMGLSFPPAKHWDHQEWYHEPGNAGLRPFYNQAWEEIRLRWTKLIPNPPPEAHGNYHKAAAFLAAACATAQMEKVDIQQALDRIVKSESRWSLPTCCISPVSFISVILMNRMIVNQAGVARQKQHLQQTGTLRRWASSIRRQTANLPGKLRSLSPRKRLSAPPVVPSTSGANEGDVHADAEGRADGPVDG